MNSTRRMQCLCRSATQMRWLPGDGSSQELCTFYLVGVPTNGQVFSQEQPKEHDQGRIISRGSSCSSSGTLFTQRLLRIVNLICIRKAYLANFSVKLRTMLYTCSNVEPPQRSIQQMPTLYRQASIRYRQSLHKAY
jgi:hypothetical protein